MVFDDGERCWNGPARKCTVSLECGLENAILDVVEPNRCEYTMKCALLISSSSYFLSKQLVNRFKTPLACRTPPVEALHDEL